MDRLTDMHLRSLFRSRLKSRIALADGTVPGLMLRVGPGAMTWSLKLRVSGEAGVTARGHQIKGKTHRVTLGEYPTVTLHAARGQAHLFLDQARRGVSPVKASEAVATARGLTIQALSEKFIVDYVCMKQLRAVNRYEGALRVHIVPSVGDVLADLLTREQVRTLVKKVMVRTPRGAGGKDRPRGGLEAARTMVEIAPQR